MGAAPSRASTSMPTECTLFEFDPKESATRLFTVPHYSKWARMPAGTALNYDFFFAGEQCYSLNVYPAGFDEESADYVAVFLNIHGSFRYHPQGTRRILFFEILDDARERAVFNNYTAESGQEILKNCPAYPRSSKGYVRFVKRSELEASPCVRRGNDSFVIRCTVSIHAEVTKRPAEVFPAEAALSSPKPAARADSGSYGPRAASRAEYAF